MSVARHRRRPAYVPRYAKQPPTRAGRRPAGTGRGPSLGRASGVMALGTLASRGTGFLRTVAVAAAIGTGAVGDAYNVANTTPNILYDLLLGGVLSSVVVPVLVRAAKEDDDGGEAFASSLLTLVVVGLGLAVVVALLAAPLIVRLYLAAGGAQRDLAVTFLRWFLPQVVFYGLGATIGAILNVRQSFAAPMLTPVLNNLVVVATCVVFVFLPGPRPPTVGGISGTQTTVLALGTTLGVVAMTLALLPSLRAVGFRYRVRLDLHHPGLRSAVRMAGWVLIYVVVSQLSLLVVVRLASGEIAYTTYTYAYQLFQLPHAIIAVSMITALLPRMSAHAADGRRDLVRDDLSTGTRLAAVVLVPAALGLLVLARPIAVTVFDHGAVTYGGAVRIGDALAAFAVAIVPFSAFQLQIRAFYALQDSRTPALVQVAVSLVNILAAFVLAAVVPDGGRAVALALAFALAYAVGAAVSTQLLRTRLAGVDGTRIARTGAKAAVAGGVAALVALGVV
ncbi:MAG TPA: murein biosynthesis integral membrane protein MurJ, partial [Frankiaceae bacterium]|nr:murein biosynthesis integral membrane protein MurJ [Frankiaceae bacterium]